MPNDLYGWFACGKIAYEPPRNAPCPYCGEPLHDDDVANCSFAMHRMNGTSRSYFYRFHRTCHGGATDQMRAAVFSGVVARILLECE